jgi:hypothetical protein
MRDLHRSKEALDEALQSGSTSCMGETFEQLNGLLIELSAKAGGAAGYSRRLWRI